MNQSDLKQAYPPLSQEGKQRYLRTLNSLPESAAPQKRLRVSLAFVFVVSLLLTFTAIAVSNLFSVKDRIDPRFVDQVTEIGDTYQNKWLDLSVTDAYSNGKSLTLALSMNHRKDAQEVYVFPVLTAASLGEPLDVDVESGFDFFDGVWLPERMQNYNGTGNHLVDAAILEDILPPAKGDIEWTLTFHVLRTDWPVKVDEHTVTGHVSDDGISHEDYMAQFLQAYHNNTVLLSYGDTTVEYSAVLPKPADVDQEAWDITRTWERLVRSGAFTEVDRFSRSFVTEQLK